eukprot:CAMPEP_0168226326 /NCGR_PEP_ID=MMETSP0140_2-20121125/13327_1 /TAXON_ID=44445 /ORGANISM="Pseudo-nitzschia australis, Strain 10249 10 AB" /LENGTH=93 /DNA_ID=CAMNT_0008157353 /DNA_START=278 /DNA_END=559 /DNA_ORIENTATION=+
MLLPRLLLFPTTPLNAKALDRDVDVVAAMISLTLSDRDPSSLVVEVFVSWDRIQVLLSKQVVLVLVFTKPPFDFVVGVDFDLELGEGDPNSSN